MKRLGLKDKQIEGEKNTTYKHVKTTLIIIESLQGK